MRLASTGATCGLLLLAAAGRSPAAGPTPALEPSGQYVTPAVASGAVFQPLNPGLAGHPDALAGQAISALVSPDRRTLVVLTSGYNAWSTAAGKPDAAASSEFIFFYDIGRHTPVKRQVLQIPTAYAGLAFSPDGRRLYVGSGGGDSIYTYELGSDGAWSEAGAPIALGHAAGVGNRQGPSTAGLAVTADGSALLVADVYNDSVSRVDLRTARPTGELDLRPGVEDPRRAGIAGGETPFWVAIRGDDTAYVSSERDREIDVLGIGGATPVLRARIPVHGNPNEMVLNRAGTLLAVACDNDDSVQLIDTRTDRVVARIPVAAPAGVLRPRPRYRGAAPNALAFSADERALYVSDGGENAVAVVALQAAGHAPGGVTTALLPTGWSPNAVAVADGWLYVANGKSDPGPNPGNCQDSVTKEHPPPSYASACRANQYILQLEAAGLLAEPMPRGHDLRELTLQVAANDGFARRADPRDAAVMALLRRRIRHVIYVVKENRTYDQILGDLGRGNGDPALVEFGQAITPNFHALARQFVDLDDFLDSGEVSGNGWAWSTSARETDFNAKTIPLEYSPRKTNAPYDPEGQNRGVDLGDVGVAARRAADPNYPNDPNLLPGTNNDDAPDAPGDDDDDPKGDAGRTQNGYLWDAALRAGLGVRNYGFLSDLDRYRARPISFGKPDVQIPEDRTPYADHLVVDYPANPTLIPLTDPYFRGFDNAFPDVWRLEEWTREFTGYERSGRLPALELVRLMHDHMGSFSSALAGVNTPELQQADNDEAVGLLVQRVAHSRYRGDTLIFVVEDDAQDGPDHVDAHRSTAYVVGPYVRHGAVVSTRYTTVNMLRTIEDVLGIGHLALNDATQGPMTDVFDPRRADWTFTATPSAYLDATGLGLPRQHADAGPVPRSTHDAAWWTARTPGYDWSHEDRVPAVLFNRVVWQGLYPDRPYPTARSGIELGGVGPIGGTSGVRREKAVTSVSNER